MEADEKIPPRGKTAEDIKTEHTTLLEQIDHRKIDEFIKLRRNQWEQEREPGAIPPWDRQQDKWIGPASGVDAGGYDLSSELRTTFQAIERTFRQIVDTLKTHSRALEDMQADLLRNRTI